MSRAYRVKLGAMALPLYALAILPAVASELPSDVRVADPQLRAKIETNLARDLNRAQPTWIVRRCSTVVSYDPPMPSGHDSSWGAACSVIIDGRQQARWFCDDWLVGKFKSEVESHLDAGRLGQFVATSCPPGG